MSRKRTKIKVLAPLAPKIIAMRAEGKTQREIAEALGLEKSQIKNWVIRHNKEQQESFQRKRDNSEKSGIDESERNYL